MKHSVALIGVGGYGANYLNGLLKMSDSGKINFCGAADLKASPEAVQQLSAHGVPLYSSSGELFSGAGRGADLVCISTGIALHEPMTLEALRNGSSVLVEKPIAGEVAAAERMMEEMNRRTGKFIGVGFQHLADRRIQNMKRQILANEFGAVRRIAVIGLGPRGDAYYSRNSWAGRIHTASGAMILDSPLNNAFAHYLNLALFFTGSEFAAAARPGPMEARLRRARPVENFDACALHFTAGRDNTEFLVMFAHCVREYLPGTLRIECERAVLNFSADGAWSILRNGETPESGMLDDPFPLMLSDAVDKLSEPDRFLCPVSLALEHARCSERLYREFRTENFPAEITHVNKEDGIYFVDGLEEKLQESFRSFTMPAI